MPEIAIYESESAFEATKILDDAKIVKGALTGNHDNRTGNDVGVNSLYNEYYSPERYEAIACR